MGRLGVVLGWIRGENNGAKVSEVKVDPGGGANQTDEHFTAPGIDAAPLDGDYEVSVDIERTGGSAAVGYLDPKDEQKADRGEIRVYSRDSDGSVAAEHWFKHTGEVVLENENGSHTLAADGSQSMVNGAGYIQLQASGTVVINGVTIDTSGNINTPATIGAVGNISSMASIIAAIDIVFAGITGSTHTHSAGSYTAGATPVTGNSGGPS